MPIEIEAREEVFFYFLRKDNTYTLGRGQGLLSENGFYDIECSEGSDWYLPSSNVFKSKKDLMKRVGEIF